MKFKDAGGAPPPPPAAAAGGVSAGAAAKAPPAAARAPLYLDDSTPSFFRRPCYSPDGTLLLTPTGVVTVAGPPGGPPSVAVPTTLVFDRSRPGQPVAHYPGSVRSKPSIVVRACPVMFKLRPAAAAAAAPVAAASSGDGLLEGANAVQLLPEEAAPPAVAGSAAPGSSSILALPYRMIIAVATLDSVLVYDTSAALPVAVLSGFHCEKITDVAWAADASLLFVTSMDGYVSAASFAPGEFGEPLAPTDK